MLRGIIVLTALCLSLVGLWRFAGSNSGYEQLTNESYRTSSRVVQPQAPALSSEPRLAGKGHSCALQPMDCDDLRCEQRNAASRTSRFQ